MTEQIDRMQRWRLVLGGAAQQSCATELGSELSRVDAALAALYGDESERRAGLGASSPKIARWLGDIRSFFPTPVVQVMQQDALERLNLQQMLLEPELLETVEADVHLVANIVSLARVMPAKTRDTARRVVRKVVEELERRLREPMRAAVSGSLNRAERKLRPRLAEIDWHRTLRANLGNYLPERRTVVAEKLIGYTRKRSALRDVVLCVDQSGSMAASVVYAGIFSAVMASLRALRTRMVVFDTEVVDLSEQTEDPVELLFGIQLGGGTDINRALGYCQQIIDRPEKTILVLITDLYEGGNRAEMLSRAAALKAAGVNVICLLALADDGAPGFDHQNAAHFATLGIPAFACTPDRFPELMAAAIQKQDLGLWAAKQGFVTNRPE
ncbi:VWA domain-containing protein [Chitinimonas taiwanensis]|uniref:VWA domain containing CoxE-like protein n=1 Tax=Chitinimonas taiwanensis DSM 18899 TaxID=1121279 RepID=A0A1K2H4I1_9NEIS|nr:VWA domain-containing protein [Chitinimonas taiwanensis]SFZ70757.1 VWA domain containing CoxE-like protein [Chitinimonas taiwanensis DSM 18899]